ncbi:unnamed protein product [Nesidiocoris tenuis]|uniref:Uncharacterized protein n=1 Tax=Nesidiocoris tenuis TaxID=355587 RepID=A0A6H5H270_9HEMI|nr:unnamed protein product [Nesidiocoris tenuis]
MMEKDHLRSLVIIIISLLCYSNSLNCGFVFDDISAIKENRDLRPHVPLKNIFFNDFWGTPIHKEQSHKSYRPLCVLTFRLNYYFQQLEPFGYHAVNVFLHSLVCLMYFKMCSMFLPELPSFISAILFTVHPIHTEAVTGVVGRAETLSSVFFVGAFILYGYSTKEKKQSWHLDQNQLRVFFRFDNPASAAPTPHQTIIISSSDIIERMAFDISVRFVLRLDDGDCSSCYVGLAFTILPFLPASNIFFPVGFVVAERVLYLPSMGFCMLISYGWYHLYTNRFRKIAWAGLTLLVLIHGCKTYRRNWDWENEYSLFMAGLRVNQQNAKLFNNVGHALESQGRYLEALQFFNKAVSVQEDDIGAYINVGRTYNHLNMYKEAEEAYLKAKSLLPKAKPGQSYQARIAPNHLNVFLNLANLIAKNETRLEEADLLYRQAISMRADYTQAYINRGDVLLKLNRTKEAQEVYERALFYDNNNPDIYYNLGVVFLEQGKASQALAYLDKALEYDPEHEQALLNSAILLQELGRAELRKLARERLLKLLHKDPNNERVHFNLGMLAMDDRDLLGAEDWFRRAIQIKPDFRSALFNLALLLADDHRPLEAAPFLNQLVKYHPDHVKGLILLGDIYINNIKDLDAAENCYKRILELEPNNIQGVHNLCVVYVERGALDRAEACLKQAHELAPKEDYVLRHLAIVQSRIAQSKVFYDSIKRATERFANQLTVFHPNPPS